jgi:hypothetical protein
MHNNDIDKFFVMLNGISDYYGKQISKGVMRLYWEGLRQYDFEAVEKAFWTHTQNPDTGQFMPKIADVAKYLKGRTVDQASQAWSKVDKAIRIVGTYQDVVFDDPIIHRVIEDMGGWISFGNKREDEWPFVQNHFENRYRGFVMREEMPEYQARLIGIANAQNAQNGFPQNLPVLIGNREKAEAILNDGSNHVSLEFQSAASNLNYLQ